MKKEKGYMLTETIIAIAIILVISFSFFSLSLFVNSNYQKSTVIVLGLNQIENILTIFEESSFLESEEFTTTTFEENLNFAFDTNETNKQIISSERINYSINFNSQLNIESNGEIEIFFEIIKTNTQVSFSAKILKLSKQIYEMPNAFFKAVA